MTKWKQWLAEMASQADVVDQVTKEIDRRGESAYALSPNSVVAIAKRLKITPAAVRSAAAQSILRATQRKRNAQPFPFKPIPEPIRQYAMANHVREGESGFEELNAPEMDVPLAALYATQQSVDPDHVNDLAAGRENRWAGDTIDVLRTGGNYHIWNGHHAAAAALARGDQTIRARVLDL